MNVVPTAGATGGGEVLPAADPAADPATTPAETTVTLEPQSVPAPALPPASQDPIGAVPKWVWGVGAAVALAIALLLTTLRG
jgi:hypothetical protein